MSFICIVFLLQRAFAAEQRLKVQQQEQDTAIDQKISTRSSMCLFTLDDYTHV